MAIRRSAAPTLADVAAEAGVSQATASRALADSPLVNANTRQRVWEVAERLHFQPNRLARSLRSGATMAVGLVVPDVGAAFYASALKSAQDVLEAAGYHVLVLNTGRAAEREREALRTLRAHQVDGLLVATSGGYEEIGVPAVFFDNVPTQPGAGAVAMDNDAGMRLLVEHLVADPRPRADRLPGPARGGRDRRDRRRCRARGASGSRRSAPRSGAPGCRCRPSTCRTSEPGGFEDDARVAARELMALERPPTRDRRRHRRARHRAPARAARRAGVRVPDDVALVSFDEPGSADLLDPPMTSLDRHDARARPDRRRGAAAHAARRRLPRWGSVRVPAALSVRRSCGCDLTERGRGDANLCGCICNRLQS